MHPQPTPTLLLGAIAAALLTGLPAHAQGVTPYGPESDRLNAIAYRALTELDFDTAIINYRRARDLAQTFGDRTLRLCGTAGAEASLQGAQAQKDYMRGRALSPQTRAEGDRVFANAFDRYWQQFDAQYPDLVNGCP